MTDNADFSPGKIAVVGAGPVGCVLAASLANAGHEIILCDLQDDLLEPAIDPGIRVQGALEVNAGVARTVASVDELADDLPALIFITTKATALPLIASAMEGFHQPGTFVVSWQNGLDTERVLSDHIGSQWVMRAAVNFGVTLLAPGQVNVGFHHPPHWLQEAHPDSRSVAAAVCDLLSDAGLPTSHAERIVDPVWQKTILNAALGPVCAITRKTMSQALHDPFLRDLVEKLLREGINIARANEVQLGWDYYRYSMTYLEGAGDHKPSMLVDIENGRITEAEFINGRIAGYGEIVGLEAPYNTMMRTLVKALES
jgi:2-dehydropantoate 2-reductase